MPAPDLRNGDPCWIDLFTSDPDRSTAFYDELFGWTHESAGEEFGGYINFSLNGAQVAGGMKNDGSSGQPDAWTIYLKSPDAEKTIATAEAEGGQSHMPAMPVGELGVMGLVADPGGAAIGLWQPGLHTGFGVLAEPGAPSWFELHTNAYDASLAFYRSVFGWETHTAMDEPEFKYTTLGEGDEQRAGVMDATAWLPEGASARWSIYFSTPDADASQAKAVELGAVVVDPAQDTPYGRLGTLADPTGAIFKLQQPPAG
jgi:predicted enzyme related to lactoylglutathione lyase